jgi:hypothetical protein
VTDHRPLILLDVDGPLNPWKAKPTRRPVGYATFRMFPDGWHGRKGLRVWLNPRHGDMLGALADATGGELVWATTWLEQANELIGPKIGLPELPVMHWDVVGSPRWKFDAALRWACGRPLVWFDDDFTAYPRQYHWFTEKRSELPTLLRQIDPRVGLTFDDVSDARDFLLRTENEVGDR